MKQLSKTIICEYKYDSEEERDQHVKDMELQGVECSGQVRRSDDSLMNKERDYYWYAKFYKQL
ncbi:hypothetical protein [Clostridium tagluense]|uniref:Uncharacterized protein n=1 Tax=Clostridium tagluense TaxID=360422 RepID=A0A401UQA3_9CLOT|nr:hypothetical protein [Clostridium tagluense]GCD11678.1 hypothetical protein Ctaglu_33010 [Clostridium tagluense]